MRYSVALTWAIAAGTAMPSVAEACGGCFAPSETQQVVTDHRMVMAVHADRSILWDQIRYTGRPEEFSWILPVSGEITVRTASGEFFDRLDASTAVRIQGPVLQTGCPGGGFLAGASSTRAEDSGGMNPPTVEVIRQEVVGPYESTILRSTNGDALTDWLRAHSYVIPPSIEPVIQFYVGHHMDFVALRLRPGEGVEAMQPIRIEYHTANMVLPLRMVAAGVADKVGLLLWVFGSGRYEAQNFPNATIDTSQLEWDFATNRSNYQEVFRSTLRAYGNRAWITEYAQPASSVNLYYQFQYENSGIDAAAREDWRLATHDNDPTVWVSRLRTDLAVQDLSTDLSLQASASNDQVSNFINVTRSRNAPPPPRCPSGSTVTVGGGAGISCNASSVRRGDGAPGLTLVGVLAGALALAASRRRRARETLGHDAESSRPGGPGAGLFDDGRARSE